MPPPSKPSSFTAEVLTWVWDQLLRVIHAKSAKPKVLIVEDSVNDAHLLTYTLEQLNCSVVTVYDGSAALDVLDRNGLKIIFLDVRLPYMDGIKVLEKIRRLHPYVPTVLLSGSHQPNKLLEALEGGFCIVMNKTNSITELRQLLVQLKLVKKGKDV